MRDVVRRPLALVPLAIATIALARATIGGIYAKVGHAGAPLDDAYIHFQYARAIAELHPFRFQAGAPISTGATSFVWPIVLALPYAAGFRGESILWPAWILSYLALGALARETYLLAKPLAGRVPAIGAGAMVLAFGGYAWFAASGMEVVPFAWLVAFASRRAVEWVEAKPASRTRRERKILLALAIALPFVRPEGSITTLVLGAALSMCPLATTARSRSFALAFVLAALGPNLVFFLLTGHATSSTAEVKLLVGNPYYSVVDGSLANAQTLVAKILNGDVWSAEFLPHGGAPIAFAGLASLAWRGFWTNRAFRAAAILVFALSMFVPCAYYTFLWNRLRYLWPFAAAWFIGLACLARVLGDILGRIDARLSFATSALVSGAFAGALAMRLDWVLEDVAQSASGIDRQQVALGHWANQNLPKNARIGVNDTGAIAYFSHRSTFDVVGLTTPSEGKYWVAGAASRLEHYERLKATTPDVLPTHFIVYPDWMNLDTVLGRALHESVVPDATILGGSTMRVYEARWSALGSGERPWTPMNEIVDEIDVADIESERAHRYELLGAREGDQEAEEGNAPDGAVVLDGGRTNRSVDRFFVRLSGDAPLRGVMRVQGHATATLRVATGPREIAAIPLDTMNPSGLGWVELPFEIPNDLRGDQIPIEVKAEAAAGFTSFHYWFGR